jgi:hypothetical protein
MLRKHSALIETIRDGVPYGFSFLSNPKLSPCVCSIFGLLFDAHRKGVCRSAVRLKARC